MGQMLGCVKVDESKVGMKEAFGKHSGVLQPGCHCVPWYCGVRLAGTLCLRVKQLYVPCETKTKDNLFVTVVASIQYRVVPEKAVNAYYKLSNTTAHIQSYVYDAIRSTVPKMDLASVFENKDEIARAIEQQLAKAMLAYGYEILQTHIVNTQLDPKLKEAMKAAEAEKVLKIKSAEGEAESKYLTGLGMARQRQAIVEGLKGDSVLDFSENVPGAGASSKDITDMVMVNQYFDTVKEIGWLPKHVPGATAGASSKSNAAAAAASSKSNVAAASVVTPHGPGAVKDVASQIRDGILQGTTQLA